VIHSSTNVILLAFVTLWSLVVISGRRLLLWLLLILSLSTIPLVLGGLHVALGAIVGIMSHFATLEATIGLNWVVVPDWCSWCVARMILLLARCALSLLIVTLQLLLGALTLLILLIVSTLSSRTRRKTLRRAVAGAGVATGLPLRLELALLFTQFLALALQAYSFI